MHHERVHRAKSKARFYEPMLPKTTLSQTERGSYLVCLTRGTCTEFTDLWEAEEHIRNLEKAHLTQGLWDQRSW